MGLIPGWGRSPGEGTSNLLQYSCLGNPRDRSLAGHSPWGCKRVGYNLATKQQQHISVSVQFSSVAQSCPTLCDPMNRSTPGLPVHHQLPEFTQTRVRRVSDAIQPSHPRSSPSSPAQTILSFLFSWMFISWISVEFCPRHFQHL